jgi:hypothetical protein
MMRTDKPSTDGARAWETSAKEGRVADGTARQQKDFFRRACSRWWWRSIQDTPQKVVSRLFVNAIQKVLQSRGGASRSTTFRLLLLLLLCADSICSLIPLFLMVLAVYVIVVERRGLPYVVFVFVFHHHMIVIEHVVDGSGTLG